MSKQIAYYDIEVLPNLFLCCVKVKREIITFEISERRNDLMEMLAFFTKGEYCFAGYNCIDYDTPIMNMIIKDVHSFIGESYKNVTEAAYQLSRKIIYDTFEDSNKYKFLNYFKELDLMTLLASKALRVGLKSLQVTMFYENVQEMVVDWNKPIEVSQIDDMIFYCHNDVDSTAKLGVLLQQQIELRQEISRKTGIKNLLSKDPVNVGVEVFTQGICKELNIVKSQLENYKVVPHYTSYAELIQPCIKFKSLIFNEVLEWFKNSSVTNDNVVTTPSGNTPKGKSILDKTVIYNNLRHTFAQGGLHSVNQPKIYTANADMLIIDIDAESMYPTEVDNYGFGPAGFWKAFKNVVGRFKKERVLAKVIGKNKEGKYSPQEVKDAKVEDQTKKLSLNSIIGYLRKKNGPYMAPQANAAICINGQLMLAMLIERMEDVGFECISSNTDGITLLVPSNRYEEFKALYQQWGSETLFKMEETHYEKMVIFSVNDYIAYKEGYNKVKDQLTWDNPEDVLEYNYAFIKTTPNNNLVSEYVKAKGLFGYYSRLGKGLDSLIVAKALIDYYGKGVSVKETITKSKYIYDYIIFQKVGKQYDVIWNGKKIQHINRFYVSKTAPYLYKSKETIKADKKTGLNVSNKSMEGIIAGQGVQIFNKFEKKSMGDYKINYSYYINRCVDIIQALEPDQLELFNDTQ